jgi:hypothetical protein
LPPAKPSPYHPALIQKRYSKRVKTIYTSKICIVQTLIPSITESFFAKIRQVWIEKDKRITFSIRGLVLLCQGIMDKFCKLRYNLCVGVRFKFETMTQKGFLQNLHSKNENSVSTRKG